MRKMSEPTVERRWYQFTLRECALFLTFVCFLLGQYAIVLQARSERDKYRHQLHQEIANSQALRTRVNVAELKIYYFEEKERLTRTRVERAYGAEQPQFDP